MECPPRISGRSPKDSASAVQGDLDREQRRLGVSGLSQEVGVLAEHHVGQRPFQQRVEVGADLVQRPREDREGVVQLPAHRSSRWAPWPVNSTASRPSATAPETGPGLPEASASRPATRSVRLVPKRTARSLQRRPARQQ
ncbi:hypothetical protein SALBM311S_12111 [Streptomyces alboniger]